MQFRETHETTTPADTARRKSSRVTRITILAVSGAVLLAVIAGVGFTARGLFDPQWNLTIARLMESGSSQRGISNPVEITDEVCADAGCVEAFDTSEALYLRFGSRDAAAGYVNESSDAFQSNYIVMDFSAKPDAEPERQRLAMEFLISTWQDYEGTLPTRH